MQRSILAFSLILSACDYFESSDSPPPSPVDPSATDGPSTPPPPPDSMADSSGGPTEAPEPCTLIQGELGQDLSPWGDVLPELWLTEMTSVHDMAHGGAAGWVWQQEPQAGEAARLVPPGDGLTALIDTSPASIWWWHADQVPLLARIDGFSEEHGDWNAGLQSIELADGSAIIWVSNPDVDNWISYTVYLSTDAGLRGRALLQGGPTAVDLAGPFHLPPDQENLDGTLAAGVGFGMWRGRCQIVSNIEVWGSSGGTTGGDDQDTDVGPASTGAP